MSRRRKFVAGVALVTAIAITGVAVAALIFRLRGTGTTTGLNTSLSYTSANGTSDGAGLMDPTGPGMSPTRASYNIATSTLSFSAGELSLSITNNYPGYWVTAHAVAASSTHNIVIQRVVATGTDAALVTPKLDPQHCGDTLQSVQAEVDVAFQIGAVASGQNLSFGWDVEAVPASEYVAGNCNGWTP